jgi:4-methylaminobutanoate oxidase (formaldehyde-forming)
LAKLGERDVVLVDRDELTSGSTFHSAGLIGQLRADPTLTRMNMYSVELYRELQAGEQPPGFVECGGIKLASSPERLEEIRRQIGWARTFGLPLTEISAREARELFPLMDTRGVVGAAYLPTDGYIDPSQLTYSLIAGARAGGVQVHTRTRVLGIDTEKQRVCRVRTDRGDIETELVVDCGGMFAAEIARMVGVRVPIVPMSHQYLVTEGFRERTGKPLPTLRDPDRLIYFREEVDGLIMGGYERDARPFALEESTLDAVPADFNGRLLAEDWPRFEEIMENAQSRVPQVADVGIRKLLNGPEAFTPDNEFCLGETAVGGFFVAAGFCAHGIAGAGGIGRVMAEWIVDGEPSYDVWHMDIRRFGRHYESPTYTLARVLENYETYYDIRYPNHERTAGRPLRVSPAYSWHVEADAFFGEKSGWERVNYYRTNAALGDESLRPRGWAGQHWSPAVGAEHLATREAAGLFDESSFSKIQVTGAGSAELLEWLCDNRVARDIGAVTYTQALNQRGGIECDFTVTRVAEEEFMVVTGTAFGTHDAAWIRRHAQKYPSVRVTDVTGQWSCFALWGPRSRQILRSLTPADLNAFPFMTMQEIPVGPVPVRALRVTFVGELGWELYCPSEYGATLWRALWAAGREHGLVAGGYRAIDSMRLEKGYRVWGSDLGPARNPYEAGLGFCVKLDKPGGFLGRDALLDMRQKVPAEGERLRCITLADKHAVALGNEPVSIDDNVIGRITSGGFGYTVEKSIAYAYLPIDLAKPGMPVTVEIFGEAVAGEVAAEPLFDPRGERIRA